MEVILVAVIALVVLGPKKLPEAGKSLGQGLRGFKASLAGEDKDETPELPTPQA
jgi:sec-independent protein translocase protein TatA